MKYIYLPIQLIRFWYIGGLSFFARTWKNLIQLLEEDLAVGLMWRLLLVPLFHDSSIVGKLLSFCFRLIRILIGLFALALATLAVLALAFYWFSLPGLIIFDYFRIPNLVVFLLGIAFFILHTALHPAKKIWQVKENNFWLSSRVKKSDLSKQKLINDPGVEILLEHLEVKPADFSDITITEIDKVGMSAYQLAKQSGVSYLNQVHFFVGALFQYPQIEQKLAKFNLTLDDFKNVLIFLEKKNNLWRRVYLWDEDFVIHHLKGVNRGWLGSPTPKLDQVSEDITRTVAKEGYTDYVANQTVLSELTFILSQESNRNVILVGPAGSGKSALIHYLAKLIVSGDAPPALAIKRLVRLDTTELLSGEKTQGDMAQRVKDIFEEVQFAQNVILVIDEIHNLGIGEAGGDFNLYSLITPYLESSTFQFLATTEPENYSRVIEKNSSFARLFSKVELNPASSPETLQILENKAIRIERSKKAKVSFLALKVTVELANKLMHDRVLPDSAIALLDEAVAKARGGVVTKGVIQEIVGQKTKVPVVDLGTVDKEMLLNLEKLIHDRLIDQEEAVKAIADVLRRSATGLREESRPIGSFLFVGPTGVGKTELSKTLSELYFKSQGAFLRFDMSEYQNPESVVRLIGGNGEGGQLTEAVRQNPYSLILLDEFEKANSKILTLFLQVLDDGRLTDGVGRTVDFKNTIIIATSNAGSLLVAEGLKSGKTVADLTGAVKDELLKVFRPELVNRFDEVVIFKPLSETDLEKIVVLKLDQLKNQLKQKGFLIEFDLVLISELAKRGFDPVLGARPLRRLIQDTIEARLSKMILENKLSKGQIFRVSGELLQS